MRTALAIAAAVTLLTLTGCSEAETDPAATEAPTQAAPGQTETAESTPSPTAEPTEDEAVEDEAVEIEIEGDRIEPNGLLVEAEAGEPVVLQIRSDRAGEFHVHSAPEQVIGFEAGETRVELTIDRPGVVDVEEHESGVVVLQLEVS